MDWLDQPPRRKTPPTTETTPDSPKPENPSVASGGGISTMEIMELPRLQREVMLLMMREGKGDGLTLEEIQGKFPQATTLPETLSLLMTNDWLMMDGEPPRYRVSLKRKQVNRTSALFGATLDGLESDPPKPKPRASVDLFKRLE